MAKLPRFVVLGCAVIEVIVIGAAILLGLIVRNGYETLDGNGGRPSSSLIYGPPSSSGQSDANLVSGGTPTIQSGWKIYHNDAFGFELQYPATWQAEEINNTSSWAEDPDPPMLDGELLTIGVPSSTIPASAYVSAKIFVGVSTDAVDVSGCATGTPSYIGRATFYRFDYNDAATAQFYNNVDYEMKRHGACYAVQYLFTSGVGLSQVKIADYRTLVPLLDPVLQTFRFTD